MPGAIDAMQTTGCPDFRGSHFIDGAGHIRLQQEQPDEVSRLLLAFLAE